MSHFIAGEAQYCLLSNHIYFCWTNVFPTFLPFPVRNCQLHIRSVHVDRADAAVSRHRISSCISRRVGGTRYIHSTGSSKRIECRSRHCLVPQPGARRCQSDALPMFACHSHSNRRRTDVHRTSMSIHDSRGQCCMICKCLSHS